MRRAAQPASLLVAVLLVMLCVAGCATERRPAFTAEDQRFAAPTGFRDVRMTPADPQALGELVSRFKDLRTAHPAPLDILSLSGGGADGAYGAGVLYGWSERGDRPLFDIVTGVSTGALAAPLAYLGPAYDELLKQAYTGAQTTGLLDFQGLLAFFKPSLFRGRPLALLIEQFITEDIVRAVAVEHAKGRWLLVATSNLDTQNLVLWNLGAIAATGGPESIALFRKVLLASASVPGVFPPVMIDVQSQGRALTEMHVDGSTITSFFAVPESLLFAKDVTRTSRQDRLYVLINGKLGSEFAVTPRAALPILQRSFDTMSKVNTRVALGAVAAVGERAGFSVAVSYIPQTAATSQLDFDPARMTALFELGRMQASKNETWQPAETIPLLP